MILTNHARKRIDQRGIPLPAVLAVAKHGEVSETESGCYRAVFLGYVAVIGKNGVLVTAYEEDKGHGKRAWGPKRAARFMRKVRRKEQREAYYPCEGKK